MCFNGYFLTVRLRAVALLLENTEGLFYYRSISCSIENTGCSIENSVLFRILVVLHLIETICWIFNET